MSSSADSLAAARQDAVSSPEPAASTSCPLSKKDWIEIVLQDEDGNPVPNAEYLITTPDGQELSGTLDGNGFARVDGITPGTCKVSFTQIHKTEWKPA